MTLKTVYHALSTDMWDAADLSTGPHSGTYASERKDGHGRSIRATERAHSGNTVQTRRVLTSYSPTGQPEVITRRLGATSASDITRWMGYDTLGRMVLNVDPHTSAGPLDVPARDTALAGYEPPDGLFAWTYFYDYAGDLIGTEDARSGPKGRCGVDFTYDALGRLLGEDYFPGEAGHQDHSSGLEVAYYYDGPPGTGGQEQPSSGSRRLRAIRIIQALSGFTRIPAMCTARVRSSITRNTMIRTIPNMPRVSTAKKSQA